MEAFKKFWFKQKKKKKSVKNEWTWLAIFKKQKTPKQEKQHRNAARINSVVFWTS